MAEEIDLVASRDGQSVRIGRLSLTPDFGTRYELRRQLGTGASGMVWEAYDRKVRRAVAIKFMMALHPDLLQRFRQEGQLMARVSHPNLAAVYDMDAVGAHPYLVTELLSGGTLKERQLPLPPAEVRRIGIALLDARAAP